MINKKGVTLLELVVVMAIIAIGAVLVAPNIGAWIPNYRLKSATRELVSILRTAQVKAVSTNVEYRVSFPDAQSYVLQYLNTDGINWVNEGITQTLPAGILISSHFPGNNAHFNPNSTSSSGSLTLANPKGFSRTITLSPSTGRARFD